MYNTNRLGCDGAKRYLGHVGGPEGGTLATRRTLPGRTSTVFVRVRTETMPAAASVWAMGGVQGSPVALGSRYSREAIMLQEQRKKEGYLIAICPHCRSGTLRRGRIGVECINCGYEKIDDDFVSPLSDTFIATDMEQFRDDTAFDQLKRRRRSAKPPAPPRPRGRPRVHPLPVNATTP